MKQIELCEMCTEYSKESKCEIRNRCKLLNILRENEKLKEENRKLKKENADKSLRMSYMRDPNAIGDRCEMGG